MHTFIARRPRRSSRGFSLLETVVTVAILTTITSVDFYLTTNIFQNSRAAKLTAQVASLNQTLRVNQANGGDLRPIITAQGAINHLKTKSSNALVISGLRGSMVDSRLVAVEREAGFGIRAYWNDSKKRFALKEEGKGIFEFALTDAAGDADYGSEERTANLKLAERDSWVWDYKDFERGGTGPGEFPLNPEGSVKNNNPGGGETGGLIRLLPPTFNLPSQPEIAFYTTVELIND